MPANFDLKTLNGKNGFKIVGTDSNEDKILGRYYYVNTVGDINHDGISDIAIGIPAASSNSITQAGTTYVIFGKTGSWNASVNITTLDGSNGFVIYGRAANEQSGYSVAGAGDINNDGIADFIVGPFRYARACSDCTVYVIFGKQRIGGTGTFDLSTLDGSNGFLVNGLFSCEDYLGISVSGAGDVNGDGIADILIGAPGLGVYVIYGKTTPWDPIVNLINLILDGHGGFRMAGDNKPGTTVSAAGDLNGDGLSDCFIRGNGNAWVIFGSKNRSSNALDLRTLSRNDGFNIVLKNEYILPFLPPVAGPAGASRVAGLGDINADGLTDILISSPTSLISLPNPCWSYVIFGKTGEWDPILDVQALNGSNGFALPPVDAASFTGFSIKFVGDFNGDGIDDLIIGSKDFPFGKAYLVFGKQGIGASGTFKLSELDGSNGMVFSDAITSGSWIGSAGDINGDGISDLLIGAPGFHTNSVPGTVYVVFGYSTPQLVTNQLTINQGETRVFTAANLNATDLKFASNELLFTASNVQQGVFSWSNGTKPIFSFAQYAVQLGQILFIHDASNFAPSYAISVTNSVPITTIPNTATVSFNVAPVIVNNTLTLKRSQTVILTANELAATDLDDPAEHLIFTVSHILHGQFSWINQPKVPLVTFLQSQINARQVQFAHDGDIHPPSYTLSVNDGKMNNLAGPQAAVVHFDVGNLPGTSSNLPKVIGGIAATFVSMGLIFFGTRYVLNKRAKKSLHDLLASGAPSYEIELQDFNSKVIGSITNEVFEKIKTTNILSYRSEDDTRAYVAAIQRMIWKLNEFRINLDFAVMDVDDKNFLLGEIIRQTRQFTVSKQTGYLVKIGAFFRAEITPNQLDSKVNDIAFAVKESVTKHRPRLLLEPGAPSQTLRGSVERSSIEAADEPAIERVKNIDDLRTRLLP